MKKIGPKASKTGLPPDLIFKERVSPFERIERID